MNKHIEKYLENYIEKQEKAEFAVLLNGKWGSGKTYFINQIIDKYEPTNKNIKFIKISFFEVSNKNDLQHQIIMKLLGIKNEKGWFGKSTKVGATIVNSFGKKLGLSIYDIPIEEILSKINKTVVFIFDDLERTNISLHQALGYINNYVEILKFNVIILANESEINDEKYKKFKEKVIGKTFEVQHDFNTILISLINEKTDKSKKYLNENKNIIKDIYSKAKYHNLRHIKQVLLDFEYFIQKIDENYLNNKNFIIDIIKVFFLLSIEVKAGKLKKDELLNYDMISLLMNKEEEKHANLKKILKKYKFNQYNLILSQQLLVKILFEVNINEDELNNEIKNLQYFKEQESWKKLWKYVDLEDDEFIKYSKDVTNKFNNNEYIVHEKLLHVFGILLGLSKNSLHSFSINHLIREQKKNIDNLINNDFWKENLYEYDSFSSYDSLGYHEKESTEFKAIKKYIEEKSLIAFDNGLINKAKELLINYNDGDINLATNRLEKEFRKIAIFSKMNFNKYIKMIHKTKHKNLYFIFLHYKERYYEYTVKENPNLKNDLEFWENVYNNILKGISKDTQPIKYYRLGYFKENIKKYILDKLRDSSK